MRTLRLSTLLAASLTLVACGTANRLFQAGARTLHLAESRQAPDNFRLEAQDVHGALVQGATPGLKPRDTRSEVAQR